MEKKYLVNDEIVAKNVLLFDADGERVGVVSVKEAMFRAKDEGLDLMQVSKEENEAENYVVCKMLDYKSFLYHEQKRKHKQEVKNKHHQMKEMRFRPSIGENDMDIKVGKIAEMLEEGHKVKVVLQVKGREKANGSEFVERVMEKLEGSASFDVPPKIEHNGAVSFIVRPEKPVMKPKM